MVVEVGVMVEVGVREWVGGVRVVVVVVIGVDDGGGG